MATPLHLIIFFFFPILSSSLSATSPLDPQQLKALKSLNLPKKTLDEDDPCNSAAAVICDSSAPFRHVISLTLSNLSRPITAVSLSRFPNLTDLSISRIRLVSKIGLPIILSEMKSIRSLTVSNSNLSGYLPKHWHKYPNLTRIDLSYNSLKGVIPGSITQLEKLQSLNLSSNGLSGEVPDSIGDLSGLENLSLGSNSLSGSVPDSIKDIPGLIHLDLGSNRFNGSVPRFISRMSGLKYLNLEKNEFEGVMPFNSSFISKLVVFKIGENSNLCYNRSSLSMKKVKLGIAPCDKYGLPLSPPPAKGDDDDSSEDDDNDDYSYGDDSSSKNKKSSNGPNKVVLGVAIGLSAVVFLIIFCVLISKCCR